MSVAPCNLAWMPKTNRETLAILGKMAEEAAAFSCGRSISACARRALLPAAGACGRMRMNDRVWVGGRPGNDWNHQLSAGLFASSHSALAFKFGQFLCAGLPPKFFSQVLSVRFISILIATCFQKIFPTNRRMVVDVELRKGRVRSSGHLTLTYRYVPSQMSMDTSWHKITPTKQSSSCTRSYDIRVPNFRPGYINFFEFCITKRSVRKKRSFHRTIRYEASIKTRISKKYARHIAILEFAITKSKICLRISIYNYTHSERASRNIAVAKISIDKSAINKLRIIYANVAKIRMVKADVSKTQRGFVRSYRNCDGRFDCLDDVFWGRRHMLRRVVPTFVARLEFDFVQPKKGRRLIFGENSQQVADLIGAGTSRHQREIAEGNDRCEANRHLVIAKTSSTALKAIEIQPLDFAIMGDAGDTVGSVGHNSPPNGNYRASNGSCNHSPSLHKQRGAGFLFAVSQEPPNADANALNEDEAEQPEHHDADKSAEKEQKRFIVLFGLLFGAAHAQFIAETDVFNNVPLKAKGTKSVKHSHLQELAA